MDRKTEIMWFGTGLEGSIKNWPVLLMSLWWLSVFSHFALDACGSWIIWLIVCFYRGVGLETFLFPILRPLWTLNGNYSSRLRLCFAAFTPWFCFFWIFLPTFKVKLKSNCLLPLQQRCIYSCRACEEPLALRPNSAPDAVWHEVHSRRHNH